MARVKRGFKARRRRNRVRKLAKGFHFDRSTQYRWTAETVKRALHYSYISRRLKKRDMRRLWIIRISAAVKLLGSTYSKFIGSLKAKNIQINRKMLSEIAATDMDGFRAIYEATK
ncbi:MAG: 50S ribosomal protein L20 [Bacteriovoracaceae bacterium]|nr:50S ribosomal protein L20 [Bacteriovoracaceae bacterium]